MARVLRLQEGFKRFCLDQGRQDLHLLFFRRFLVRGFQPFLHPQALGRVLNVHVLNANGAGVSVTQAVQNLTQRHLHRPAEAQGWEDPVQIPHAKPVAAQLQVGVATQTVGQGIKVGCQVPAGTISVDQALDAGALPFLHIEVRYQVLFPPVRRVRDTQGVEDAIVKTVLASQLLGERAQELAGLRALNDPVVVGGCGVHGFPNTQVGKTLSGNRSPFGWIVSGANPDDGPLARHETRHRVGGSQCARVRQGNGRTLEVVGCQFARAGAGDQVVESIYELGESKRVSLFHDGHHQRACAIRALNINRDTQPNVGELLQIAFTVFFHIADIHAWHLHQGLNQRVTNQVSERDLAPNCPGQVRVDERPVFNQQLRGNFPSGSCGRNTQGRVHVARQGARGAAHEFQLVFCWQVVLQVSGRTDSRGPGVRRGGFHDPGWGCGGKV